MLYDISPAVDATLKVWRGDTPPRREILLDLDRGDNITLSTLHSTVHAGAHADAPSHYGRGAPTIEACDLQTYLGPCQVVSADVERNQRVAASMLRAGISQPRVLIATRTYPDPTRFNEDFAGLEPALIDDLHRRGVRLIGVDTPSVDLFNSKALEAHEQFLANEMAILEGLVLDDVPDGVYELVALPLKLVGFDASPVRAVLRSTD